MIAVPAEASGLRLLLPIPVLILAFEPGLLLRDRLAHHDPPVEDIDHLLHAVFQRASDDLVARRQSALATARGSSR